MTYILEYNRAFGGVDLKTKKRGEVWMVFLIAFIVLIFPLEKQSMSSTNIQWAGDTTPPIMYAFVWLSHHFAPLHEIPVKDFQVQNWTKSEKVGVLVVVLNHS